MSAEWAPIPELTDVPAERLDALYSALGTARSIAPLRQGAASAALTALRRGEGLAPHTSIRIGGPADLFLAATRADQVVAALRAAHALGVPCRVIGGASNLLVADEGIAGLVVKNLVHTTRYEVDPTDPE